MRRHLALALCALLMTAAAPPPAPVSPTFEALLKLCLPFRSQPIQALNAADAAGWAPASRKMVPPVPEDMTEGGYRFVSTRTAMTYLLAGYGPSPYDPQVNLSYCAVTSYPEDTKAARKIFEAWVGMAPDKVDEGGAQYYSFIFDPDGTRRAVDVSGPLFERGLREGRAGILMFVADKEGVFISLWTPAQVRDA